MDEVCLSIQHDKLLRWQQAFPKSILVEAVAQLDANTACDATIWLHEDGFTPQQVCDLLAQLQQLAAGCRPIVISCLPEPRKAMLFFQHGARGYCHAMATPDMLKKVALVVRNGGLWLGPEMMNRLAGVFGQQEVPAVPSSLDQLTRREQQVAQLVATGASNKEVAHSLDITERTVKAHMSSILEKLALRDRLQLALLVAPQK